MYTHSGMHIVKERELFLATVENTAHTAVSWCIRWMVNYVRYFHVSLCALSTCNTCRYFYVCRKIHFNIVKKSLLYVMLDIKLLREFSQQYCLTDEISVRRIH